MKRKKKVQDEENYMNRSLKFLTFCPIRMIKSRRIRFVGHVTRISLCRTDECTQKFDRKTEKEVITLGPTRTFTWGDNIKMCLEKL